MKVKDMSPRQRAERALRRHINRQRRTFGLLPPILSVEKPEQIPEDCHFFVVRFKGNPIPAFYDVRLYEKSARVREV